MELLGAWASVFCFSSSAVFWSGWIAAVSGFPIGALAKFVLTESCFDLSFGAGGGGGLGDADGVTVGAGGGGN